LTLDEFQSLYRRDAFYTWFGLDSPLLYAAHKAAGGMTSVYRQIGMACERLFHQLLQDTLGLTAEQAKWSYVVPGVRQKQRKLSLDGRIPLAAIADQADAARVRSWLQDAAAALKVRKKVAATLEGPVFEVRRLAAVGANRRRHCGALHPRSMAHSARTIGRISVTIHVRILARSVGR
jgi:hypothetical protein